MKYISISINISAILMGSGISLLFFPLYLRERKKKNPIVTIYDIIVIPISSYLILSSIELFLKNHIVNCRIKEHNFNFF
jgi:hypothetical protein